MSEHNDDWLTSLDRAVEVTEGQIELATALKDAICNLQRRVGQLESDSKPEHICVPCFAERIITATQKLKAQVSMAHA